MKRLMLPGFTIYAMVVILCWVGGIGLEPLLAQDGDEYPQITTDNAAQVTQLGILERSWINQFAWSSDGTTLAIASPVGVWTFNAADWDEDPPLLPSLSEVWQLAYMPDGTIMVAGLDDGSLLMLDVATGDPIRTIDCAYVDRRVDQVVVSTDGAWIWCGSDFYGGLAVVNIATGQSAMLDEMGGPGAFLPDPNIPMAHLSGMSVPDMPSQIAQDPTGTWLAAFSDQNEVELRDLADGSTRFVFQQPYWSIQRPVAFSPTGEVLAISVAHEDLRCAVRLFDVVTGDLLRTLTDCNSNFLLTHLSYQPGGNLIAGTSAAGEVYVWDATTGERVFVFDGFNDGGVYRGGASSDIVYITAVDFAPDGTLATGSNDYAEGGLHLWNPVTQELLDIPVGENTHDTLPYTNYIHDLAYSLDGTLLATANGTGNVWDIQANTVKHFTSPNTIEYVALSPDNTLLASVEYNGTVTLWDLTTEEARFVFAMEQTGGQKVSFNPDGTLVASNGRIWDTATGELFHSADNEIVSVFATAFSPDGAFLAGGEWGGSIWLWRVADGEVYMVLNSDAGVRDVAFNPDGSMLASGHDDGTIILWDIVTGERITTLRGHTRLVTSLAFSPDGSLLASGSADGTTRLWGN